VEELLERSLARFSVDSTDLELEVTESIVHPNRIKIDMSLVRGIGAGPQDEALVHAVLALAKALGAVVLAEGVETMEQHDFLLAHGCREMQGFLFARPLSFDALLTALQDPERLLPKRPESLVPC